MGRLIWVGWLLFGCSTLIADASGFPTADLRKLISLADSMLEAAEAQKKETIPQRKPFDLMSPAELKAHFSESPGCISSREQRGWKVIRELAEAGQDMTSIAEVWQAIRNIHRRPAPMSIHFLAPPILFWDHLHNPVARGELHAANVPTSLLHADFSVVDPKPSTFWERPGSIKSQNLFAGFGRATIPRYETNLWEYAGPKTSWGGCPGFEARCGELVIKVKLAEIHSEPFTARIFHALGFHVDATDYVPHLKITYSRRLFREFHLRKDLKIRIRALGLPVHTINLQKRHDPFSFVSYALLKDGTRMSGRQLKSFLLRNVEAVSPEDDVSNFSADNEAQVEYLVITPANVQLKDPPFKPIGPWTFDGLGHEHLRELRGAGLLAAWVGWHDSRFENTRLKVFETTGQFQLAHFFSDLGGGLGKSVGVLSRSMESPELFPWTFTKPRKVRGKGRMTTPFKITHFAPIDDTGAFEQMTMDDARWMGRLIAQLTEAQIVQALTASGFTPEHVKIYTDKLISRRDRMIRDLELSGEIPPLRAQ